MTKTIEVTESTLQVLLLESFRYCLGRQTYAVSECVETLIKYWSVLPEVWQDRIQHEIDRAIYRGVAEHECDIREWKKLLDLEVGGK